MLFLSGGQYILNWLLDLVEVISDESFWLNLLGERLYAIIRRYTDNDAILFYVFLSFFPAISEMTRYMYSFLMQKKQDLFYVSVIIGDNELIYTPINEYVTKNFKGIHKLRHARGKTGYSEPNENVNRGYYYYRSYRSDQENTPIIDLTPEKYYEFKINYKGYNILVNRTDEASTDSSSRNPFYGLAYMRTDTIEIKMRSRDLPKLRTFIQEWVDEYYNSRKNKLIIYKCNFNNHGWDDDNQWKEHGYRKIRSFDSVVLKKGDKERILNDIMTFKESKAWYSDRGIPYRRGYLLHGPPGTGKTSFIQSLASRVKMNVAILNLTAAASDDALASALAQVPKSCILVIEDVDHYKFEEGVSESNDPNKSSREKTSVSVSGILNAIDGIASLEESIIFMTCNDMNGIPPALIRPGRIDLKLHLGYVDDYQAELIFWKFFCMAEKEKSLEDIKKEDHPLLRSTVNELIQRMRKLAQQTSASTGIQLEISPAEFISYLLFHALTFNLSKNPDSLEKCCQSLLDHVQDFVKSVSADRIQAIEHAKKKKDLESKQEEKKDSSSDNTASVTTTTNEETQTSSGTIKTVTTTTITTKEIIPTPPTSPAAEKQTVSKEAVNDEDVQELGV